MLRIFLFGDQILKYVFPPTLFTFDLLSDDSHLSTVEPKPGNRFNRDRGELWLNPRIDISRSHDLQ